MKKYNCNSPLIAPAVDITAMPNVMSPPFVFEDDHGRYSIGLADDGAGFESRTFAMAVAERLRLRNSLAGMATMRPPDPESKRPAVRGNDEAHSQVIGKQISTTTGRLEQDAGRAS
jgi:hypothetical protein